MAEYILDLISEVFEEIVSNYPADYLLRPEILKIVDQYS